MGSTAGRVVYEGGGGYTAAKHAIAAMAGTLRLELSGQPVRVTEIAPGMVRTDEFAMVRFRGDAAAAAKVYEGVAEPLTADDIADCVAWCVTRPPHVDVDLLVVRPLAQAAQHKVHRVLPDPDLVCRNAALRRTYRCNAALRHNKGQRRARASAKTSWTPGVRRTNHTCRTWVGVFSTVPMAMRAADSRGQP